MMMPRKKRKTLIIVLIVFLILIIIATLIALYVMTDAFKSDSRLFTKYIGKGLQNVGIFYDEIGKNDFNELLKENKYTSNVQMKISHAENIGTTLENLQDPINMLKLEMDGQIDRANNYNYQDIRLTRNSEKISEMRYIQNNEVCGVEFSDFFVQYVLAKNENLKQLFKTIGFTDEQLTKVPDKMDINNDFYDVLKFSEEEKQDIATKYTNIIVNSISTNNFSKLSNQKIELGEESITANAYVVQLSKEQLNNIYINLLNELKQDEIILKKLDQIEELISEYQIIFGEIKNIRGTFTAEVQNLIDDITQSNIGDDVYKISVYETNGVTIGIGVQGTEYEYYLKTLFTQDEKYLEVTYKKNGSELDATNEKMITLKKTADHLEFVFENTVDGQKSEYNITTNEIVDGNNSIRNIMAKYEDDKDRIELSIDEKLRIVQAFENEIVLNDENSVNLSNLTTEQSKAIIDRVNTSITEKVNDIKQNVISSENIVNILVKAKLIKEKQVISGNGITDTERNRFNSKFEILKGENLERNEILNLLNAVKDNLVRLEVVSDTQLKLVLDRFNKNEEMYNIIRTFIENNGNRKYTTTLEYDETTGLINDVLLTMLPKK